MPNKRSQRWRAPQTRARRASPRIRISHCRRRDEPEAPSSFLSHTNRAIKLEAIIKETYRWHQSKYNKRLRAGWDPIWGRERARAGVRQIARWEPAKTLALSLQHIEWARCDLGEPAAGWDY